MNRETMTVDSSALDQNRGAASNSDAKADSSAELWRSLFAHAPHASLVVDLNDGILEINQAARELLQLDGENVHGRSVKDLLARLDNNLQSMIRVKQVSITLEQQDFSFIYLQDIREQHFAERLLLFFATTLKALDLPSNLSKNDDTMVTQAARFAVESLAEWCRIDIIEDAQLNLGALAHVTPTMEPLLLELHAKMQNRQPDLCDDLLSPGMVIRSGISLFKPILSEDYFCSLQLSPQTLEMLQQVGLRSYICVPIRTADEIIGSIAFGRSSQMAPFDPIDLIMAEEFATKVGVNIERARLYKSLAEMKNAAEAANRAKTNFLANVSHEIRTPLGAIVGFSELLLGASTSDGDRANWGAKIRRNSRHLLRIINDILDLSKVEAGKLNMELIQIDLNKLLHDVYGLARARAAEKAIQLEFVLAEPVPHSIFSDETRLSQILSNIIGNAVKFTSHGYVRVTVGWKSSPGQNDLLFFEVSDTGPGLTEAQAARLFQPFSQADTSYTRQFGGTGLGLALSRNLARGLGGDLILHSSQPGQGSSFLITIDPGKVQRKNNLTELIFEDPLTTQNEKETEEDTALVLKGKKILLVEDSEDIQVLFKRFLEGAGADISLAVNGAEGVIAAQADSFDIVLMDVQMPIKDGCEATRELRAYGYEGLIVALTAHAMKEEYNRCMEAGYDAHLSKPIRRQELIMSLAKLSNEHKMRARKF